MNTRKLAQSEWQSYFDVNTGKLQKMQAMIEVASLSIGDQIESDWTLLFGITYDPKDNSFSIAVENLNHIVRNPNMVYVAYGDDGLEAIEIEDSNDVKHIVRLRSYHRSR